MLRLWPERFFLGWFPDSGWLHSGSAVHEAQLLQGNLLQQLLPATAANRGVRPTLEVIVGGDMARLQLLPWQPLLRTEEQQRRYAEACFESEGIASRDWVIQAAYRHFGTAGVALALRREVVDELIAQAAARRLRLRSVLPAAAAAYWRYRPARLSGELLVLDEGNSMTALSYTDGRFSAIDVQAVGAEREIALTRLLRRARVAQPGIARLTYWSALTSLLTDKALSDAWPEISQHRLAREVWL